VSTPASAGPEKLISVVICTRNRDKLLRQAIASVVDQTFPRAEYEIVVVDNASTDRTREVAVRFQADTNLRYLYEERLGLCNARNKGWRAARGRYVAFFDDDAIALPGWLAAIRHGFETVPTAGVIGGRVDPIWQENRPAWLSDKILGSLTVVDWGSSEKFIDDIQREWVVGANMAVPKALLEEVDGFHPWLDRAGTKLLSSGDVFLQCELMERGYRCFYLPTMAIEHLIPASRLSRRWFLRRFFWQGVSDAVMFLIKEAPSPARRARVALARSGIVLGSRRTVALLLGPAGRADAFAGKCLALIHIGFIAGLLGAAGH